ncbi:hypothetical protein [Desulfovibrio ferrophilus]|uniref:Uncharacterized protein n=1 Tax=Desulfovibrio ferrophilus TaxID=241368 RepID=A0A2Z6AYU1_9BACT|nr:hypothetical protein [Desulfovibrio ferrophilus]BBD08422.1 uncharacterized protein DFE_1696 [Desulfovibrio ferrophilus]
MLQPGMDIMMQRGKQRPVVVRVDRRDARGFWVGFQHVQGRVRQDHLRTFRGAEVQAVRVPEGFQKVLPGVLVADTEREEGIK